jgi:hypothetical protein
MPIEATDFEQGSFVGSFEKARRLLKKFLRITFEDALIIASSRDPYQTSNPAHLHYHRLNKEKGRMCRQVRIRIRYEKYMGKWFDFMMVSREEMEQILKGSGWEITEFLNSEGPHSIAIIRKIVEQFPCEPLVVSVFPFFCQPLLNCFSRVICLEAVVSCERCGEVVSENPGST